MQQQTGVQTEAAFTNVTGVVTLHRSEARPRNFVCKQRSTAVLRWGRKAGDTAVAVFKNLGRWEGKIQLHRVPIASSVYVRSHFMEP
jgi:hypothetical protein